MWTPPINESAELTQGVLYVVNSLRWDFDPKDHIDVQSLWEFFRYKLAIFIMFLVLRCISKAVDFIPFYRNLWLFQQSDMKNAQCIYPRLTTKPKVIQNFTLFFQSVYFSRTKTM